MEKQKQLVIKTISTLGRRASAADVATKTGLPISTAFYYLNKIAEETCGRLQVSKEGDIAYSFPTGFQTTYLSAGLKRIFKQAITKLVNFS